jgi:hypothetical protein
MTESLEKAIAEARRLPADQQDALAAIILDEIEDEARWDAAFARSHDVLERLAQEAEEDERRGGAEELDPNAL